MCIVVVVLCVLLLIVCVVVVLCIVVNCIVFIGVVVLWILLLIVLYLLVWLSCVYCCHLKCNVYLLYYVCIAVFNLDAGLLTRIQYSEGPATGHLDTGFS